MTAPARCGSGSSGSGSGSGSGSSSSSSSSGSSSSSSSSHGQLRPHLQGVEPTNSVWNTLTGEELLTLEGHKNVVYAIA
eukprot:scaffold52534_cov27-Phaeocystis_antarctica.AAC.1